MVLTSNGFLSTQNNKGDGGKVALQVRLRARRIGTLEERQHGRLKLRGPSGKTRQ